MLHAILLILCFICKPPDMQSQSSGFEKYNRVEFDLNFKRRDYSSELYKVQESLNRKIKGPFTVKHVTILSYSSMEGDSTANLIIRNQRASGVLEMLRNILKYKFEYEIKTSDTWNLFKNDVGRTTAFGYLKEWPKAKVYSFLQSEKNKKALEPVLKNHRFVKVIIKYDESERTYGNELNDLFTQRPISSNKDNETYIANDNSQRELLDSFFQEVFDFFDEKQIVPNSVKLPETEAKEQIKENIKSASSENIIIEHSFDKEYHRALLDSFFQEVIDFIDKKEFTVIQQASQAIEENKKIVDTKDEILKAKKSAYKSNPELTDFRTKKDLVEILLLNS